MKESKRVNIKNTFLDVSFNCNKFLISMQVCIAIGLIALAIFAKSDKVMHLAVFICIVDVIYLIVMFARGLTVSKGDAVKDKPTGKSENKKVDVTVDNSGKQNKKTVQQSNGTINNKVAIPNPKASEEAKAKDVVKEEVKPVESEPVPKEEKPVTTVEEMSEDEWMDLFSM